MKSLKNLFREKPSAPDGGGLDAGCALQRPRWAAGFAVKPLDKERSRICRKAFDYIRPQTGPQQNGLQQAHPAQHLKHVEPPANHQPKSQVPCVVLDTNVVLDWLMFNDPRCRPMVEAIEAGQVRWMATQSMRDELASVLTRPFRSGRTVDAEAVFMAWKRWASPVDQPEAASIARYLYCTDPDDQMFIDLAVAIGARWLLTRDRALLALARRARAFGVTVLRPDDWTLVDPSSKLD